MAYSEEKIEQFRQALATLEELAGKERSVVNRDALIQRFEYTVEACWKALKTYLFEYEGIDAATPKGIMREAGTAHIFSPEEVALALIMIDDRNKSSHVYSEEFADVLYDKIKGYIPLLQKLLEFFESNRGKK